MERTQALPASHEAEQSVLGALMLDNQLFDQVLEILRPGDFHKPQNRLVFTAMMRLMEAGQPLDVITVSEQLERDGDSDMVGGLGYLAEIARATPTTANLMSYARIVREQSDLRRLIVTAQDIASDGFSPSGRSSKDLIQQAEQRLLALTDERPADAGMEFINPLLKKAATRIDELANSDSLITGLATGFYDLDEMTSGWQKSDLIILAARPSMGKTSFAMNTVEHAILHQDKPVVVFSLEMPSESIIMRLLSSVGRIDQKRLRTGRLEGEEWDKLMIASTRLKDRPLYIDDTPGLTPAEMRARLRRLQREQGEIALVMVDYLQLMRGTSSEGRTAEISEISRMLKGIAREFNCPVIALSQLNRSVESRPNKRPVNSDLRDSGAIEQDADVILFIYRDEVYHDDSPDKGTAELIIGKQRNGPIGMCRLAFLGKYTRFDNLLKPTGAGH